MINPVQVVVKLVSNKGEAQFTVTDDSDNLPIEGANVSVVAIGAGTTDAQGKYSTGLINKGTYNYTVGKINYNSATGSFTV